MALVNDEPAREFIGNQFFESAKALKKSPGSERCRAQAAKSGALSATVAFV
ncbi:MAG: hypothetical protein WKG07_32650 [Hymenobacter sp.]